MLAIWWRIVQAWGVQGSSDPNRELLDAAALCGHLVPGLWVLGAAPTYGSRDAPFVAGSRLLVDSMPHVIELRIEGSGHHPLVEDHDRVVAEISTFLQQP